ncbi:MAG: phosphate acyltransferase PlsX [Candidatus Avoscillospira sp.]
MRILIDAMGGDHAPDAIVQGAIDAAKEFGVQIVLVGRGETILKSLGNLGLDTLPKGIEIANADDVVDMHDDPASVVRTRKESSMVVGLRMLAEGTGDAFISAGSTGALLSAATLIVKRVKGIRRAAMCPEIPTETGSALLIDCGANAECTPEFLLQFALLGSVYARKAQKKENPKVGLLNIGTEDSKGTQLQKDAYVLLQQADAEGLIQFAGNVEARDVPLGAVDVVVADGFSGNVLLKTIEGTATFMNHMLKGMFKKNLLTKVAALICKDGLGAFKRKLDYREVGGTMLLGISKPVVKAHGSSDARAIRSAVRQAMEAVSANMTEALQSDVQKLAKRDKKEVE